MRTILSDAVKSFADKLKPRGLRNNNPTNLRLTSIGWEGKVPNQYNTDGEFEQFFEDVYGIRAGFRNMKTQIARGHDRLSSLISIWAPPSENNTQAYINQVARQTGFEPSAKIRFRKEDMLPIMEAVIRHENGKQPYSQEKLEEAWELV